MKTKKAFPFGPWLAITLMAVSLGSTAWAQSPPVNLTRKGFWDDDTLRPLRGVVVGNYAYVACLAELDPFDGKFIILNVTNLPAPFVVGRYDTPGRAIGVAVAGHYAYVGNNFAGLHVFDVGDPSNPVLVGIYGSRPAGRLFVAGNTAYVASGFSLLILDVSNPASPNLVGSYDSGDSVFSAYVVGNYAYVANNVAGLQILDISNPASPRRIGGYDTSGQADHIMVVSNYAYVADHHAGLQVVDISDPAMPKLAGGYDTSGFATEVAVVGNYAYVADDISGLLIMLDVSNPASPRPVASYSTSSSVTGVAVSGYRVYLAALSAGLVILEAGLTPLTITRGETLSPNVTLSWTGGPGIRLQETADLNNPLWQDVPGTRGISQLELPVNEPSAFFRLAEAPYLSVSIQPTNLGVRLGSNATFTATVVGTSPFTYQWRFNGQDILDATNTSLTITNVQLSNEGSYTVVVTDTYGPVISPPATLQVLITPVIVEQPQSQTNRIGDTVIFRVAITGNPPPFTYEWRKGSTPLLTNVSDLRFDTFTLSNVQLTNAGNYRVVIKNAATPSIGIASAFATLTVVQP